MNYYKGITQVEKEGEVRRALIIAYTVLFEGRHYGLATRVYDLALAILYVPIIKKDRIT